MSDLFPAIAVVFALGSAMAAAAFTSSLRDGNDLARAIFNSAVTGSGFAIYAFLDYLLIVPGKNYLMVAV